MTAVLNPKLLDVVSISAPDSRRDRITGTVVDLLGSGRLIVEVSDENGVGRHFLTVSPQEAQVEWESKSQPHSEKVEERHNSQVLFEEGMLLLQNGQIAGAEKKFAKSFEIDPDRARGLLNATLPLVERGDFDTAIFILRFIVGLQPEYQLARENLAITHLNRGVRDAKRGFLDKAFEDFTNALLIGQSSSVVNLARRNLAAAHTQVALKHVEIQRFNEALNLFLMAFQLEPSSDTKKNFALALVSRSVSKEEGRSQISEEVFNQAILMGLTLSECLNASGATLARLGDLDRARQFLKRALEADPKNERAKNNLELLRNDVVPDLQSLSIWTTIEAQAAVQHPAQ